MDGTRGTRTPNVVGQSDFSFLHLSLRFHLASQLFENLNHLTGSGCSEWMTFGLETPAGVHRHASLIDDALAFASEAPSFSSLSETEVFGCENFSDGKAVMNFGKINVSGCQVRHFVGFSSCRLGGFELGDGWTVVKSQMVGGSTGPPNPNGCVRHPLCDMVCSQHNA